MQTIEQITIAIPTYKRIENLTNILDNLESQTNKSFCVVISNDDPNTKLTTIIKKHNYSFRIKIYDQKNNLGLIDNYLFLLSICNTKYFMWHADDDMISKNYLDTNIKFLEKNHEYICSVGSWMYSENKKIIKNNDAKSINQSSKYLRYKFFIEQNSDHFIYGVFQTDLLKKYKNIKYFYPNNNKVENWCFHFLIQMLNNYKFNVCGLSVYYDNLNTKKYYEQTKSNLSHKILYKIRRLNVNIIYIYYFMKK